jgi:hypothetical protein
MAKRKGAGIRRDRGKTRRSGTRPKKQGSASQAKQRENTRNRAFRALREMRHGASFSQATRNNSITARTFKKHFGSALVQDRPGGRIHPTKSDRFVRYMQIPGPHGQVEIKAHGSKEATEVARYKAAVNRFLGGDLKALAPWRGKKIAGIELVTDRRTLKSLAQDEKLPYSLYRSLSGGAA